MISAVNDFLDDLRGGRMAESPVVRVEQGELQGRGVNSPSGKAYYSFQGIPYAKPPLGSLRFKAPQPVEPWDGVRDATAEGNVSAQFDPIIYKEYIGDENCLFLNVYTPNLDGEFLPVMVFIHGGGFRFGSGNTSLYGPDYLVEKDVVIVTLNYRCGVLGFLSLNTPEVPGNAGLKDVVQALRWVKENIGNFGGNSGNITVFGESAGGVITSIVAASPLTKNLVNKVIIQSGTALNSWAFTKDPIENAKKIAQKLGCESNDVDEILEFLTATPVRDLIDAYEGLLPSLHFSEHGVNLFAPVIEKEFPGVESVLTEPFIDILNSGRIADVPVMIGSTALEFTFERGGEDLQSYIPADLHIERNSDVAIALSSALKTLYFKDKPIKGVESMTERFELVSDVLINVDTYRFIQYLVKTTNKPIYYYKFDYVGELNASKNLTKNLGLTHAAHADELGYLFTSNWQKDVEPTAADVKMRERMLRLWTNFAKTGNPTPEENHFITVTWQPVTKDNLYCLTLAEELSLTTNPDKQKMEFWEDLYTKHYRIWDHPKPEASEVQASVDQASADCPEVHEIQAFIDTTPVIVEQTVITTVTTVTENSESGEIEETVVQQVQSFVDPEPIVAIVDAPEVKPEIVDVKEVEKPKVKDVEEKPKVKDVEEKQNGVSAQLNGVERKVRPSNEIKMVQHSNGHPKDVIRANDPPEDDLPKNIGVNKFVNFFESLGGKK